MARRGNRWQPDDVTAQLLAELRGRREQQGITFEILAKKVNSLAIERGCPGHSRSHGPINHGLNGDRPLPIPCVGLIAEVLGGPDDWETRYHGSPNEATGAAEWEGTRVSHAESSSALPALDQLGEEATASGEPASRLSSIWSTLCQGWARSWRWAVSSTLITAAVLVPLLLWLRPSGSSPGVRVALAGCGVVAADNAPLLVTPEDGGIVTKKKKAGQTIRFLALPDVRSGPDRFRAVDTPTYPVKVHWMIARDTKDEPCPS